MRIIYVLPYLSCFVKVVFYELTIGLVVGAVGIGVCSSTRQFRVPKCQNGAKSDDVIMLTLTSLTKSMNSIESDSIVVTIA